MSLLTLSVKHGQTQEQARMHLERAIDQVRTQYAGMIQRVEWSPDRNAVKLGATGGVVVDLRVDPTDVYVTADLPGLLGMVASPLLVGLRGIVEREFKQLPYQPGRSAP
jgi:hypothetical protein